jgi:hypothetical protein
LKFSRILELVESHKARTQIESSLSFLRPTATMDEGSHSSLALAAVTFVLRHQPFAGLHQFEEVISNLLGPDPNLTLAEASAFGSFKLLYWLASVSPKSRHDRTPGWKLANYMMSEPVYNLWQFRKLIEAATERNDVEIVEFAFNHFVTGSVTVETVELAAEMGHLEVLQTFLEHDMGEYCTHHYHYCGTTHGHCPLRESVPDITDEQAKKGNWVHWGGKSILNAVENGHYDVALWLHECAPYTSNEEELEMIVCHALSAGETELAEEFLPPRKSLLDYAQYCPRLDEIEKVLAKGILKDNQQAAAKAIVELARTGRLDLIKQVAEHYDHPLEHRGFYWGEYWCEAIIEACSVGDLDVDFATQARSEDKCVVGYCRSQYHELGSEQWPLERRGVAAPEPPGRVYQRRDGSSGDQRTLRRGEVAAGKSTRGLHHCGNGWSSREWP